MRVACCKTLQSLGSTNASPDPQWGVSGKWMGGDSTFRDWKEKPIRERVPGIQMRDNGQPER